MALPAIVLVLVLLVAFIVLMPTLRAYITQQEQLREVNAQLAEAEGGVESLQQQLDRWQDPDYVRGQARDRFGFHEPGETVYKVVDPETVTGEDPMADLVNASDARSPFGGAPSDPWYVAVWDSVGVAGADAAARSQEQAAEDLPDGAATEGENDPDGAAPAEQDTP